jgi:tetratricopeptide (TPR) repeat protein
MREAHSGLLITAGVAKRLNEALLHGWTVYELSVGDPIDEAEILQNLGQALLDSGFSDTARAVFAALVARELPVRIMLPALGGLALASAASGHAATTEWAADEVERVDRLLAPNYALASALVECAVALSRIGRDDASERCRQAALRLALAENYYEVAYRAEDLDRSNLTARGAPSRALTKRAARIARALEWMEPQQLPAHVALATIPA